MTSDLNPKKKVRGTQVNGERGEARLQGEEPHVQVSEAYCGHDIVKLESGRNGGW